MADRRPRVDYYRYLASREWALKKRAVRERSGGVCERCNNAPMRDTHHLTYERLGNERMDDLLGVCRQCHEFLSGITDVDPEEVLRAEFDSNFDPDEGGPYWLTRHGEWVALQERINGPYWRDILRLQRLAAALRAKGLGFTNMIGLPDWAESLALFLNPEYQALIDDPEGQY